MQKYLVLGDDDELVSVESTPEGAREVALDYAGPQGQVIDETAGATSADVPQGAQARENPTYVTGGPRGERGYVEPVPEIILQRNEGLPRAGLTTGNAAFERSALPQVSFDEVMDLTQGMSTLDEVFDRLEPHLRGIALGKSLENFSKWQNFLGQNYKTAKGSAAFVRGSRVGNVQGLSLLPFWQGFALIDALEARFPDKAPGELFGTKTANNRSLPVLKRVIQQPNFYNHAPPVTTWHPGGTTIPPNSTWCRGSSHACRSACLVLSGQQLTNFGPKVALAKALMEDPVAFCAALAWHCRSFFQGVRSPQAFVRLNVLADIPWEIVFPGLFEICQPASNITSAMPLQRHGDRQKNDAQFYDYAKIAPLSRSLPENYDLTLSFNGDNWKACEQHLKEGYRVAVVFAPVVPKMGTAKGTRLGAHRVDPTKGKMLWDFPPTFMEHNVVDGDSDDMRALDPAGVIVGLTYKKPKYVEKEVAAEQRFRSGFVVPVADIDGQYVATHIPRHTGAFDFLTAPERTAENLLVEAMAQFPEYGLTE